MLNHLPSNSHCLRRCSQVNWSLLWTFASELAKEDGSPVTAADKKCERLIREAIAQKFPKDAILGEEEGESELNTSAPRRWIIDPIDGTYNYARAIPIFSTLLALEKDGEIVLGVVYNPAMDEIFWAEKGLGAFRNGKFMSLQLPS
jgi:histidinol-phosphatase